MEIHRKTIDNELKTNELKWDDLVAWKELVSGLCSIRSDKDLRRSLNSSCIMTVKDNVINC